MACLLKSPSKHSKGILSFTTPEELRIRANPELLDLIRTRVKPHYITCLHYNWHNFDAKPDDLFDVHFAGEEDLIVTNGKKITRFDFDACNFSIKEFSPSPNEKHWDILFVARAVFFKGIDEFLQVIRELYDKGEKKRVLFICPMPDSGSKKTVHYDLRQKYNDLFNEEERDLFNLLIIRDRYPFFFDRETLAHFYKSSRIFVHTAPDERRCRVAAYAWATGIPVVGMKNIAAILPPSLRKSPGFFEAASMQDFFSSVQRALRAVETGTQFDVKEYQSFVSEIEMVPKMKNLFAEAFGIDSSNDDNWYTRNLDIRLGRHHGNGTVGPNNMNYSLNAFMETLLDHPTLIRSSREWIDPERSLEEMLIPQKNLGLWARLKEKF